MMVTNIKKGTKNNIVITKDIQYVLEVLLLRIGTYLYIYRNKELMFLYDIYMGFFESICVCIYICCCKLRKTPIFLY